MAMNEYDINLVTSAKNGDTRAFEELYDRYYGKIFALACMTVKNEADAEDILQQAFLSAWRNMHALTSPEAFSTWLQKITLNQCYSLLRKKNIKILMDAESETEDFTEDESDEFLPAVYAERDDLRSRLGKIIDSLSEVQKQTVVLHYFNEQKVEEIAYIMECNVGTVKSRLFLARKAIRAEVEEEERKSGEKFYGVAGIPMLSLGSLLNGHFEAQLLTTDVIAKTIAAISEAISQGIAEGAATIGGSVAEAAAIGGSVAAESSIVAGSTLGGSSVAAGSGAAAGGTATAATATTATGLSAGAKGAIISAIAVVGIGCGIGGVFLANSFRANDDEVPDIETPPAISQPIATPSPTPTQTPEPVVEEDSDVWKQFYIDLINEYRNDTIFFNSHARQTLLYINDDNIPELILCSNSEAGGSFLFTSSENGIDTIGCKPNSFSYIERGDRILFAEDFGWYRGMFIGGGHKVYGIQDGVFALLHTGSLDITDNSQPLVDDIEWDICIWDGENVSWDEYKRRLENAFNSSLGVYPSSIHLAHGSFTPDELIEIIRNW